MLIAIFIVLYFIVPPGIFMLGKVAKDYLKSYLFGRRRSATAIRAQSAKEGLNRKMSKRIKFTLKDPRNKPIPFRLVFLLIYLAGITVAAFAGVESNWILLMISFSLAYVAFLFAIITANKIVAERDQVLKRIVELKGNKMRFMNKEKGAIPTPASELKVTEWSEDLLTPVKMYLYMPTEFDILEVDGFLQSFNLIFGDKGSWVADTQDENYGGFDFNAGVAAIKVTPPLPERAMWHERYLNSKDIHWSYFPLALGSENGVPVYNEELDRVENVLGFAVNSGQEKLSKKNGVAIGREITASPQILMAGATGGGKSLSSRTKIEAIVKKD